MSDADKQLQELLKNNPELEVLDDYTAKRPLPKPEQPAPELPPETAVPIFSVIVAKTVRVRPYGKARPRVTQGGQHTFMPAEYENWKEEFVQAFGGLPIPGLVRLTVVAIRPMPKKWSKAKKNSMRGRYATPKPDTDNIAGAIMDALFPDDDDIVVDISCKKLWGDEAMLDVTVEGITYE